MPMSRSLMSTRASSHDEKRQQWKNCCQMEQHCLNLKTLPSASSRNEVCPLWWDSWGSTVGNINFWCQVSSGWEDRMGLTGKDHGKLSRTMCVKKCSFGQIWLANLLNVNDISIKIRPHMSWLISYSTDSWKMLKWKTKKENLYIMFLRWIGVSFGFLRK